MSEQIAEALLPVFFVMALGFLAGKRGLVDNRNLKSLINFVMMFALPCSLFIAISRTPRAIVLQHGSLIFVLFAAYLIIYGITFALQRGVHGSSADVSGVQASTVSFPNSSSIGLPLLGSVFGPQSAIAVAIAIAVGSMTVSPITLAILESGTPEGQALPLSQRYLRAAWKSVCKPVVIGPLIAVAFALMNVHLPDLAIRSLALIGQATAGSALFLTGLILSAQPFRLDGNVWSGIGWKNLVQPGIVFLLARALNMSPVIGGEAILMAAIPTGFFGIVFGAGYDVKPVVSSSTLIGSSVAGVLTLALWIFLVHGMH